MICSRKSHTFSLTVPGMVLGSGRVGAFEHGTPREMWSEIFTMNLVLSDYFKRSNEPRINSW